MLFWAGVLQRLLIGNGHPLVPLRGPGLEALDHFKSVAVAGFFGIALVAGMADRCCKADRKGGSDYSGQDAHAQAGGSRPIRLVMILSTIRFGSTAVIRCRSGSGAIW